MRSTSRVIARTAPAVPRPALLVRARYPAGGMVVADLSSVKLAIDLGLNGADNPLRVGEQAIREGISAAAGVDAQQHRRQHRSCRANEGTGEQVGREDAPVTAPITPCRPCAKAGKDLAQYAQTSQRLTHAAAWNSRIHAASSSIVCPVIQLM